MSARDIPTKDARVHVHIRPGSLQAPLGAEQ